MQIPRCPWPDDHPQPPTAHEGHVVTVDVTPPTGQCPVERAHVRVASVHVPSDEDVYNLVRYAPASGDDAVDQETIDTIFSSLRLHTQ